MLEIQPMNPSDLPLSPLTIAPGLGRVVYAFGTELTFHLTGEQTGGQYAFGTIVAPPGDGPPPHYHNEESESFMVLEGRVSFLIGEEWREVDLGTVIFVPKGTVHTYKNLGDTPCRILVIAAPSGFETFFMRCEEEFCRPGGPDMARIVEISAEHGIHYVNP